ncbi:hypothetical protein R1flu_013078 [Riccia fluitans]|uniref:Uncharacterized protein n=1 Tax=Riccia fluitans TaxID=41844 RepID=A0ABD1ZCK6_9MARC
MGSKSRLSAISEQEGRNRQSIWGPHLGRVGGFYPNRFGAGDATTYSGGLSRGLMHLAGYEVGVAIGPGSACRVIWRRPPGEPPQMVAGLVGDSRTALSAVFSFSSSGSAP